MADRRCMDCGNKLEPHEVLSCTKCKTAVESVITSNKVGVADE